MYWLQESNWYHQFAGTVMISFNHVMIPKRGNWFQTNPLDHMNRMIMLIFCVCIPMVKIWRFSGKFDHHMSLLWFCKTKIKDGAGILVLVKVLWVTIPKIYWQFWHSLFACTIKSSSIFYLNGILWRTTRSCFFETSVKETVTFTYIMTFTVPGYRGPNTSNTRRTCQIYMSDYCKETCKCVLNWLIMVCLTNSTLHIGISNTWYWLTPSCMRALYRWK